VDSGELYQPLAWTVEEAHRFLREVAAFEAAGLVVRVPDWWRGRRTLTPVVRVRLGDAPPSGIGTDGLLDFRIEMAIEEEPLTPAEIKALLSGTETLLFLRGRWVEVDRERLTNVLGHWRDVERVAQAGVTFHEALRMVAGPNTPARQLHEPAEDPDRRFTRIEAGAWLADTLARLRGAEAEQATDPGPRLTAQLRPYQKAGVRWLWWLRSLGLGGCLADDMGLGKTVQVIGLLTLIAPERKDPSLLVVPASLLANWQRELARFAPSLRSLIVHPSMLSADDLAALDEARLREQDVVITTYQTVLRLPLFAAITWDVLALDEAQAIKNPGAKQTRAVKALRARTRLALTGTPVENRLGDLWSIFDFLAPGLLGSATEFTRFAKGLADTPQAGYASLRALVRPYILRRLKTDRSVIADLPDKVEVNVYCPLSRRQAALYQQTVQSLARALAQREDEKNDIDRRGLVLSTLLRLKQICNHPSQWLKDGGAWTAEESGKLARLSSIVEEIASRQEKVLVFTQFREIAEPLAGFLAQAFGRPGLVLTGSTAIARRKKLVDEFQDPAGPPFFVISLKAGGTGLNLTAATHVIHFDRWWNPAVENQATDRAFRIGQTRNVLVHKLVCRGTVEERIDEMLAGKRALSEQVLASGGEVNLTELDDATLLRTLSLDMKQALADS
jgi:SNF2 family DNA or RNA helicase